LSNKEKTNLGVPADAVHYPTFKPTFENVPTLWPAIPAALTVVAVRGALRTPVRKLGCPGRQKFLLHCKQAGWSGKK
jgi:hypothetical protein